MKTYTRYLIAIPLLVIGLLSLWTPRTVVVFLDDFFANELCLNGHCFQKPEGWINTNNWSLMAAYFLEDGNVRKDTGYILELTDGRKVILETLVPSKQPYAPHIKEVNFKHKCDYIYEDYPNEQGTVIEVINYNITIFLPNDKIVKDKILTAICN